MLAANDKTATYQLIRKSIGASDRRNEKTDDLLPVLDLLGMVLGGFFSIAVHAGSLTSEALPPRFWIGFSPIIWCVALVAPFMLYDGSFTLLVKDGQTLSLARRFSMSFLGLIIVAAAINFAGGSIDDHPSGWLLLWFLTSLLVTSTVRVLLARQIRQRERCGHAGSNKVVNPPSVSGPNVNAVSAHPLPLLMMASVGNRLEVTLLADRPIKRWNAAIKSAGDRVLSLVLMLLLLPLFVGIALAIRLEGPGPILFEQRRHGYNNHEFSIYKFRTMRCTSCEGSAVVLQQTVRGDQRVTRVGRVLRKLSLDELPQIFNVLEGNMSLVGPRPHAIHMRTEAQLGHEITDLYPHRHRVKPGITGWSQINGSRGATITTDQLRRRVELDLYYIDNWSLWLDIKILFRSVKEVLRTTNAY